MDANSDLGQQSPPEEIPSSDSLGLKHPLLPPPALGQSFLQPHTLSPLGAVSLINSGTALPRVDSNFSFQEPTESITSNPSSSSQSRDTHFPATAPPKSFTPKTAADLQPQLKSVLTHQEPPKLPRDDDTGPDKVLYSPAADQSPSIQAKSVLHPPPNPAASSNQLTSQISSQSSSPYSEESETSFNQDKGSPDEELQARLIETSESIRPSTQPHSQASESTSVHLQTENIPDQQATSAVVPKESVRESKQQPEQTKQKSSAHPPPKALSVEVSPSAHPPKVPPLQANLLDSQNSNPASEVPTTIEIHSDPPEQATPKNSEVKSSSLGSLPPANPIHSDSSSVKDSDVSSHPQPNLPKASSFNDDSVAPSTPIESVVQPTEAPVSQVLRSAHNPNDLERQDSDTQSLSGSSHPPQPTPNQEQQVSARQLAKSPSDSIQKSQDISTPKVKDGGSTPSEELLDHSTVLPIHQTVKSFPSPPNNQQTSSSQASPKSPRLKSGLDDSSGGGLPIENTATSNTQANNNRGLAEPTTIQKAEQSTTQHSPDTQPLIDENAKTPNDSPQINERPIKTTTVQREVSAKAQPSNDFPLTPTVEAKQTRSSQEPPITKNPSVASSSIEASREGVQENILQRSDSHSPQASSKASEKKQKRQSNKSKRKKIPFQTQLSQLGERARQDIDKVGIQLKQASNSFPISKAKANTNHKGSTSDSPQTQSPNTPSIQATSSLNPNQSPSDSSRLQKEAQALEPSPGIPLPKTTEIANHPGKSPVVQAVPESKESTQEHPSSTPTQEKISDPTIQRNQDSDLSTKEPEPLPNSKGTKENQAESSATKASASNRSSSSSKSKNRGQFPAPLQRLTHFSKQVMDTVSHQLEPLPDKGVVPLQRREQSQLSPSEQVSADHNSGTVLSQRTIAKGKQPISGNNENSNDIAAGSSLPDAKAQPSAPDADHNSKSSPSISDLGGQEGLDNPPIQKTTEENLQTQSLPISQAAKSPPLESVHPYPEGISTPSCSRKSSSQEKQKSASLSEAESKPNVVKPEWQTLQNQVADEIVNLGSKIKERVDRSIRRQRSRDPLPQTYSEKEDSSVAPYQSLCVATTDISTQAANITEHKIQSSAEPNTDKVNGKEQVFEANPVQPTSIFNAVKEDLDQIDGNSVSTPSLSEEINLAEVKTDHPIQTNSIDEPEVQTPQQDSEQSDATLRSQNKNSIQKSQDSSDLTPVSSDNQSTAISKSSQSRDRNNPLNSPISKIGTTIVQQLANLRPKKSKSKRKTKNQKPASPAKLSSEHKSTPSIPPASNSVPDQISQTTDQPAVSKPPTVQIKKTSPNPENTTGQSQHISKRDEASPVQNEMASDQSPSIEPPTSVESSKSENLASELPSPLADSSVELNQTTTEIIQSQPISTEGSNSNPPEIETSSYPNESNIQKIAELPSTPDEGQLASQRDDVSQGKISQQAAAISSTEREVGPIQHQSASHSQKTQSISSDNSIKQVEVSTVSNKNPQTELPVQAQKGSQEDIGTSDSWVSQKNPSADQDSLSPQQTSQDQFPPALPDSDIQHSLEQTVPAPASNAPERPPISEISIQTNVEHLPTTTPTQSQQQLTTNPHSSVQRSSSEQIQPSSEGEQREPKEASKEEDSAVGGETSTSSIQTYSSNTDNTIDPSTQTSGQNPDGTYTQTSLNGGQDYDIQDDPSPKIQAKADLTEKHVPETISSPTMSGTKSKSLTGDNTDVASSKISNPASSTSASLTSSDSTISNTASTKDIIQRSIETFSEGATAVSKDIGDASLKGTPINPQLNSPETPALEATSTPSESIAEKSNLASKPASNVPIQTVEISVVQPMPESQPNTEVSEQSIKDSDRIQASTPKDEDNLSIQPTSDSQFSPSTEPSEPQHNAPQISSQIPSPVDLPEVKPVIQASTVEESQSPNAAPTDISEASGILRSVHQPNSKSDSALSASNSINSDQVNSITPTHPNISDTETPELHQLPTVNIADSSPQVSESIQPQPDKIDSPHRRVIEISAQLPDENSGTTSPPAPELSSSSSSDLNQNQPLQPKLENNASLTEADPGLPHTESFPNTAQNSEIAEVPKVNADSDIQASTADHLGPPLTSTKSQSLEQNQPIVQRKAGATPDEPRQEIEEEHTSSDSTDSPQRRVIEIAAQPPKPELSEENSPDLTVAQLLANGQSPSPLSSISDNLVSPKHLSSLLPTSKPKRQSQVPSHVPSLDAPPDLVSGSGDVASFEDTLEVDVEGAIAPTIQRSSSHSDQALPSSWSSIEDLFTAQPQSPNIVQRKTKSPSPASVTTSDLVLTPTGIYPEQQVQRKPAPIQRTQAVQKVSATPPVSSTPQATEVVMRQSQIEKPTESEVDEQSFEILAREIYHVLRQRLEVERERHGGYHSGRLPW